jgi:monoamine oxidase
MPRTPLARAVADLARVHAEAQRRGLSPTAVRDDRRAREHPDQTISRRQLLAGSALAGASVALGGGLLPAAVRAAVAGSTPRVAVVGAGIAGLAAALTLADGGVPSTIFEASGRVGGRMHSDGRGLPDSRGNWADGQVSEWCGELIDTGHSTIRGLARRFKLETVDLLAAQPRHSEDTYYFGGGFVRESDLDLAFAPVYKALQVDLKAADYPTTYAKSTPAGADLDHLSLYDWIETRVPDGHRSPLGRLIDVAYNTEYGAETADQSSLNLVYLLGFGAKPRKLVIFGQSDERFHIVGGNERLPAAMAGALPAGTVRLGWRLTSIVTNNSGTVTLTFDTTEGTKSQTFDRVILALPFALLRTLDYRRAGFDDRKRTAIAHLGSGRNGKLMLQFNERVWRGTGPWPGIANGTAWTDMGTQLTWEVTRGQSGEAGIIVDYTGGSIAGSLRSPGPIADAASSATVADEARAFMRRMEPVYPGLASHWNGRATLSVPALDPNLRLSYAYWRVGQYTRFGGYEGVRQGNILFAGEHTSQDFQGFMEGGASEGVRAATELLAG